MLLTSLSLFGCLLVASSGFKSSAVSPVGGVNAWEQYTPDDPDYTPTKGSPWTTRYPMTPTTPMIPTTRAYTEPTRGPSTPPPPIVSINGITDVTEQIQTGSPFTLACRIGEEGDHPQDIHRHHYQIEFYKEEAGLIATYEVNRRMISPTGKADVLAIEEVVGIEVHQGSNAEYPIYEVNITEHHVYRDLYWCVLVDKKLLRTDHVSSNKWPNWPFVDFYSQEASSPFASASSDDDERQGNCSIRNFFDGPSTYKVHYYSEMGPEEINELATVSVNGNHPNNPPEYRFKHLPNTFTHITYGDSIAFPNFQIRIKAKSGYYGRWWCTLEVKKSDGQVRTYESNKEVF